MRRQHKQVVSVAAIIAAAATLLGALDSFMGHRAEDHRQASQVRDANSDLLNTQVELCMCQGGQWIRGSCVGRFGDP